MAAGRARGKVERKSPEILVPLVGLLYTAIYLIYSLPPVPPRVSTILIVFAVVFLLSAFLVWRKSRVGFVLGVVMSTLFLLNFASEIGQFFSNPSSSDTFVAVATVVPALVATLIHSILGARMAWMRGEVTKPRRMIPLSGTVALVIVGFVIGALVVGAFAGATETRLLGGAGRSADITIVLGAGTQGNPAGYFSPANYTGNQELQTRNWRGVSRDISQFESCHHLNSRSSRVMEVNPHDDAFTKQAGIKWCESLPARTFWRPSLAGLLSSI